MNAPGNTGGPEHTGGPADSGSGALVSRILTGLSRADLSPLSAEQVRAIVERRVTEHLQGRAETPAQQALPVKGQIATRALLLSLAGVAVAVFLAYVAQSFLDPEMLGRALSNLTRGLLAPYNDANRQLAAAITYALAAIVFALAAPGLPMLAGDAKTAMGPGRQSPMTAGWLGRHLPEGVIGLSVVAYAAEMLAFVGQGETVLVRVLWLGAMAFLAISPLMRIGRPRADHSAAEASPRFESRHVIGLGIIVGLAVFVRLYELDGVPNWVHGDIASIGLQSRDILAGRVSKLFSFGWANIAMLAYLPTALTQGLFGDTLFGLRMAPMLTGALMVIGLYLLAWRLFDDHRIAALAAGVLALAPAHIYFSHVPINMDPWALQLWAWFLMVDGMRGRRRASFALSGLLLGLSLPLYFAARLGLIITLLFVVWVFLTRRAWITQNLAGLGLLALGGLVALGPNLLVVYTGQGLVPRGDAFITNPQMVAHLRGKYNVPDLAGVLLEQLRRSALMVHALGDASTQAGAFFRPLFSSALSPWVALGFAWGLRRARHPGVMLMVLCFGLDLASSVVTSDPPYWPRMIGVMIGGAFFAGVALDCALKIGQALLVSLFAPNNRRAVRIGSVGLTAVFAGFVLAAGAGDWIEYRAITRDDANTPTRIGRYLANLPRDARVCVFDDYAPLGEREIAFMMYPRTGAIVPAIAPTDAIARCGGVWILNAQQTGAAERLRVALPGGRLQEHKTERGQLIFLSYAAP